MRKATHILLVLASVLFVPVHAGQQKQVPISVTVQPASELKSGAPLLLRVTISNGLSQEIGFLTYTLKPNDWNGETADISLVDIYRDNSPAGSSFDPSQPGMSIFSARPKISLPPIVQGIGRRVINPHGSLSVLIDMSKWQVVGGWKPGRYQLNVRAENIQVDSYMTASVLSNLTAVEIK